MSQISQNPTLITKDLSGVVHWFCSKYSYLILSYQQSKPQLKKTYLLTCAPSKDSNQPAHLGLVVQSIVSLTSSLRAISLTVLAESIYNILAESIYNILIFCCKSYAHFFSKKFQHICVSLDVDFNKSLTNDVVSFEQLGPAVYSEFLFLHKETLHPLAIQNVPSEDSDQTVWMCRLIWIFTGHKSEDMFSDLGTHIFFPDLRVTLINIFSYFSTHIVDSIHLDEAISIPCST